MPTTTIHQSNHQRKGLKMKSLKVVNINIHTYFNVNINNQDSNMRTRSKRAFEMNIQ